MYLRDKTGMVEVAFLLQIVNPPVQPVPFLLAQRFARENQNPDVGRRRAELVAAE